MKRKNRRILVASIVAVAGLLSAMVFVFTSPADEAESWKPAAEGFLAVATPCCTEASLWENLDTVTADEQRARPATAAEAAEWLDEWPYRRRDQSEAPDAAQLEVGAQSKEVRCVGEPSGPELRPDGDDEETLRGVRFRRECQFVKWKAWAGDTAKKRPNERHTVWVDEDGFFHGRVDYWR